MFEAIVEIHPTRIREFYNRAEAVKAEVIPLKVNASGTLEVKVKYPTLPCYLVLVFIKYSQPDTRIASQKNKKREPIIQSIKKVKNENQTI